MNLLIALPTARALILVSFTDDVRFHFAVFFLSLRLSLLRTSIEFYSAGRRDIT